MASRRKSTGTKLLESVKFWVVVGVLCAISGAVAYHVGRDYVGEHLHEMEVHQRAPEIRPQSGARGPVDGDTSSNPPVQPVVNVKEREPTSREERRALRELENPQDGAQLNAARSRDDDDGGRDDPRASQSGDDASGSDQAGAAGGESYVVVAGSFADAANAESHIKRLAERGYQPFITTQERDGITYRRVNVGMFSSREEAEGVREKLTSQGFDAAVWSEG